MIHQIIIENFRQFNYLEIKDLKRVNFFVGKSNCGKTSILEALFIITNPQNPELFAKISIFRGVKIDRDVIRNIFQNFQETRMTLSSRIDKETCSLRIKPKSSNFISLDVEQFNEQKSIDKEYEYNISKKDNKNNETEYQSLLLINNDKLSLKVDKPFLNPYGSSIFLHNKMPVRINHNIETLYKESREKLLLDVIALFDNKITNIMPIGNNIYCETNLARIDLNLMGDGFKKYIEIVAELLVGRCKYLEIDEIENGLHHTIQKKLFRMILRLSKEKNIQLFITTHSLETLKFLSEIAQEEEFLDQENDIQVINIANTKIKGFMATNYLVKDVQYLINNESEIRD